jgi:type IV pilus assembly protein PilE
VRYQTVGRSRVCGFTLIELMIVVAVVGILATIALPAYQDSIRKANRRAAQGFMLDVANREQQFFLDNRAYTSASEDSAGKLSNLNVTKPAESVNRYTFAVDSTIPAGPPPCFTITATAVNSQAVDGNMTLDCRGAKTWNGAVGW